MNVFPGATLNTNHQIFEPYDRLQLNRAANVVESVDMCECEAVILSPRVKVKDRSSEHTQPPETQSQCLCSA